MFHSHVVPPIPVLEAVLLINSYGAPVREKLVKVRHGLVATNCIYTYQPRTSHPTVWQSLLFIVLVRASEKSMGLVYEYRYKET